MYYRRVAKRTLSQVAYEKIRDAICKGEIVSGEVISESQLAEEFGMSRTPVREALRALAGEDWLEIKNGIGVFVKPLTYKDIQDLYEIRCLLEVQAIQTSIYYITEDEIDILEQRFHQFLATCEKNGRSDSRTFSELDWALHELIVNRCQNRYIKTITHSNNANMKRYQLLSVEALNDVHKSTQQHLDILALLRKRDLEALTVALRRHLEWAAGFLVTP